MTATCSARGTGWYLSCFRSSVRRAARSTWRATKRQGELAIRPRLLGQVVVAAEGLLSLLHEVLAHRATCVRRNEVERGRFGRGGRDDDRVAHRLVLFQRCSDASDGRGVLADGDVDADEVLAFLVDDRVEQDGRLARESVSDDQLTLAATERDHRVNCLDSGLHRAVDALPGDHAWRDLFERHGLGGLHRTLAVDRLAKWIHDPADQLLADGHLEEASSSTDLVALVKVSERAEDDRAHLVLFEVQGEP